MYEFNFNLLGWAGMANQRSVDIEKYVWCLQFPPKNEQKQVNLRYHCGEVEFISSFFGGNVSLKVIISTLSDL